MELTTRRFGTIEVLDENTLAVPAGIPGFPRMQRATLLSATALVSGDDLGVEAGVESTPLFWLQDLDDGDLAFLCMVPWGSFPDYDFDIDGDELGIEDESDVRVLNIITVRRTDQANTMTANLRAPLVVDVRHQRLHQVILTDSRWSVHTPIATLESAEVA
jgi:flagellar assembly factor FliW